MVDLLPQRNRQVSVRDSTFFQAKISRGSCLLVMVLEIKAFLWVQGIEPRTLESLCFPTEWSASPTV